MDPNIDLTFLVYSSGTTGQPKGVMLSRENIVSNIIMLTVGENLSWKGGKDGKEIRSWPSCLSSISTYYSIFNTITRKILTFQ